MLLSKFRSRSSVVTKSCVVHAYPDLNPWLRLVNILGFSKCLSKLKILVYNFPLHRHHPKELLNKLHSYGIEGNIHQWPLSFLQNRTMRVVVEGEHSDNAHVDSGVPQGTVLGPLLFFYAT
jgi:hypothetical protein